MNRKVATGIKSLLIIVIAIILFFIFGYGSILKFIFNKALFTPYNLVGIILTIVTICGGYISKRQGHWLLYMLTIISIITTIFSWACTILLWFKIDLVQLIWLNLLKPVIISIVTVIFWTLCTVFAILLFSFIVYEIIILTQWIIEERKWNKDRLSYDAQSQILKSINNKIIENDKLNENTEKEQNKTTFKNEEILEPVTNTIYNIILNNGESKSEEENNRELQISNNICPDCGWYLKKRINRETCEQFRGCSNYAYHNCRFTLSDKEYMDIYKKYH